MSVSQRGEFIRSIEWLFTKGELAEYDAQQKMRYDAIKKSLRRLFKKLRSDVKDCRKWRDPESYIALSGTIGFMIGICTGVAIMSDNPMYDKIKQIVSNHAKKLGA